MSEENVIVPAEYGIDVGAIFRFIYERLLSPFGHGPDVVSGITTFWQVYSVIAFGLSAFFLFGIIYAKLRAHDLEEVIEHSLHEAEHAFSKDHHTQGSTNTRWDEALRHAESENPNDWRLAIIEADIVLEGVLDQLGYSGITIGDKLKQASPHSFKTIDDAWTAHKVRNDIAHRGSDFVLTKRLTRETIEQYRRVFEEHGAI